MVGTLEDEVVEAVDARRVQVIDSHTGGEPTRIVIDGGPDLGGGSLRERRDLLREKHDWLRSSTVNEPRGSDAIVGGLLCEPTDPDCDVGIIYFNNTGYLNMCVHGTIGLAVTLEWLGRGGKDGLTRIETPVGVVTSKRHADGRVTVANVPSYRSQKNLKLSVNGFGVVVADIAWGGNWFLLVQEHSLEVSYANIPALTRFCQAAREALEREGIRGSDGGEIDHIEVFASADGVDADSRNFVLCPGGAYDRSPCGTGTSAKLACLHESGLLPEGKVWRQASILGSIFEGQVVRDEQGQLIPEITGTAFVTGESTFVLNPKDPFCDGITLGTVC